MRLVRRAYLRPSRTWPGARGTTTAGRSLSLSTMASVTKTGRKLTALMVKHQATPTVAIRMPAMAGPSVRAIVLAEEFRLTALLRSRSGTRSRMMVRLSGLSMANTIPRRPTRT